MILARHTSVESSVSLRTQRHVSEISLRSLHCSSSRGNRSIFLERLSCSVSFHIGSRSHQTIGTGEVSYRKFDGSGLRRGEVFDEVLLDQIVDRIEMENNVTLTSWILNLAITARDYGKNVLRKTTEGVRALVTMSLTCRWTLVITCDNSSRCAIQNIQPRGSIIMVKEYIPGSLLLKCPCSTCFVKFTQSNSMRT